MNRTDTAYIDAPWLKPPVTTTYRRENRLARRARMLARSPFARHLAIAADTIVTFVWWTLGTLAAGIGVAALFVGLPDLFASFVRLFQ